MIVIKESPYRGCHRSPCSDGNAPLHDMTVLYPDDIYSSKAAVYYGHYGGGRHPVDLKAINIIHSYRGKPNKNVKIYRAVPKGSNAKINKGDWVTITKEYAEDHGRSNLGGNYEIVSKVVKAKDIYSEANSIHEFGYSP